jgi:(1->4)-alpha-D-glucan 1-alpha-D-glucosylmutase
MNIPSSTYRIQLHKGFTLKDLEHLVDYLYSLGITTIYAAPILKSNPRSVHGYDVVDPHVIDPEIGKLSDLKKISKNLRRKGMTWLQDIVPNHMAYSRSNDRLMDILERGPLSPYYQYFDIDWNHNDHELKGRLQVPFLGKELDDCIRDGEINVSFSSKGFFVNYREVSYPLSVQSYHSLFSLDPNLAGRIIGQLPKLKKSALQAWKRKKQLLIDMFLLDTFTESGLNDLLSRINENPLMLKELLLRQNYVLTFWKDASHRINYRRFFTVNELICVRMEDEKVFKNYHKFLKTLFDKEIIHGFRIDHIDGLRNPAEYMRRLKSLLEEDCYVIAEKILESHERIPESWPISGTSGYEFLAFVSQLLTDRSGAEKLLKFYKDLFPNLPSYKEIVLHNKRKILKEHMAGEWDNLMNLVASLDLGHGFDLTRLKSAVGIFMVYLPVYRIYPESLPLTGNDLQIVEDTFYRAKEQNPAYAPELEYLENLFTKPQEEETSYGAFTFLQRLMQFTGPLTAKGVEDTTFYIYNALISHQEVGDSPSRLGITIDSFHTKMIERQKFTPLSLNTTSTHDTKRGEDSRVRLNVICEFADEWIELVRYWFGVNAGYKIAHGGKVAPSINDEYFIYQSIVGGFPDDLNVSDDFVERLQTYQTKVVREAKLYSDWSEPDEAYEKACRDFIASILKSDSDFIKTFLPFIKRVTTQANIYALSQLTIKLTAPGIPDTYQGCELWDLSFVDPDNRRPVDFEKRKSLLNQLTVQEGSGLKNVISFLSSHRSTGVEKLFVLMKILNYRRDFNQLFIEGDYIPLPVVATETIAMGYARRCQDNWLIVIVPLGKRNETDATSGVDSNYIQLPDGSPDHWMNVITRETIQTQRKLLLSRCLNTFPIAVLANVS